MSDREIKLRRWDHTEKTLTTPFLELPGPYIGMHAGFFNYPGRHVYQQWTGYVDKNGKDIYEGDYVQWLITPLGLRYDYEFEQWEKEGKYLQIVLRKVDWRGACFRSTAFGPFDPAKCEVIGNEYENPELKGEDQKRKYTNGTIS